MLKVKLSYIAVSILVGCVVINTSLSPAFAQATERDKATPLITNVISGKGLFDQDQVFYYRLTAKPGKMAITLDIDARNGDQFANGANVEVELETIDGKGIDLENPNGEKIYIINGFAGIPTPVRKVGKFEFKKETPVFLILKIAGGTHSNYTYRLKIDGNWKN